MSDNEKKGASPEEYTRWAAKRALELLEQGNLKQAVDSMVSDLSKDHTAPEAQKRMIGMMGLSLRNDPELNEQKVREFIEGFPGVPKTPKRETPKYEVPEYKKPELSEEDRTNAEAFIDEYILNNDHLTSAAKELAVNTVRTERGPWSVKNFVTKVVQNGNKVTISSKSGEAYLYLR